ncbi:PREDICTED: uncharacterized protein LOC109472562 [Branchiostoma belcheri]|uniref:Uncharacterized protein LOC109472562 n=1 Tax=Branchiostoma belcheri TaxID=7741 RepID=A0A6P4YFA1_BRABE|nr:PREDICTED: uncharacterized protein LOC109472562 [Branchiostoma belcheri]
MVANRQMIVAVLLVSMATSHLDAHVVSCAVPAKIDIRDPREDVTSSNSLAIDAHEPLLEALSTESQEAQLAEQPGARRPLLVRLPWPLARALNKRARKPPNMNSWGQPWGKRSLID